MSLRRTPRAALFDLDGVLLDTEPLYTQATREIVAPYGKTFDWSIKRNMIGRPSIDSARYLVGALDLPISAEDYLELRARRLEELFADAPEVAGAERFTRALADAGLPTGVATSSESRLYAIKTLRHRDWFRVFDTVVRGDDCRVARGKPAPDIFVVAAADLGVACEDCVVFEDSPAGLEAGKAAGMQVVALPDPAMDRDAYAAADRIVAGFDELDPAAFAR